MEIPESYKWHSKCSGDGGQRLLSRRNRVVAAFACLLSLRAEKGEISSFDFALLDDATVPIELFFVRGHFPVPTTSSAGWALSISGSARTPLNIAFQGVSQLP